MCRERMKCGRHFAYVFHCGLRSRRLVAGEKNRARGISVIKIPNPSEVRHRDEGHQ